MSAETEASGSGIHELGFCEDAAPGVRTPVDPRETFSQIYASDFQSTVRFLMRAGAQLAEAEDAVQYAFMQLYRQMIDYRLEVTYPRAWLRRAARHALIKAARRNVQLEAKLPEIEVPGHEQTVIASIDVMRILATLPQQQRAVMALVISGMPLTAVANILDITSGAARNQLYRARQKLQSELRQYAQPLDL